MLVNDSDIGSNHVARFSRYLKNFTSRAVRECAARATAGSAMLHAQRSQSCWVAQKADVDGVLPRSLATLDARNASRKRGV